MRGFLSFVSSLALFRHLALGSTIPRYFERSLSTRGHLDVEEVRRELGGRLSKDAAIFGSEDDRYDNVTSRWSPFAPPLIQVVAVAGEESDVANIVKYCNENSIEFLAVNRGHGWTTSLGTFNGIQIDLKQLQDIKIQTDGKSAWFGGGSYGGHVTRELWDRGYIVTTGSCACVGLMGPGLGGGHGPHEGLYGLISDNIIQVNLVLADGSSIRVNESSDAHGDLFWAIRGAGHNFGIVTSVEMKIHPRGPDTWHYHNYVWRGDKLEEVFAAANAFHGNGSTPVNMALSFGQFMMNASITDEEPVIWWSFAYRGTREEAEEYLAPFSAIPFEYDQSGDVAFPERARVQGMDENSFLCQHSGNALFSSTAGLQTYNITVEREIFEEFKRRVADDPVLAAGAAMLHEGYSTAAMQAEDPAGSAFPFRADNHLMLAQVLVPLNDTARHRAAQEWMDEVRDLWISGEPGRPVNIYVNYANGAEETEQIYGQEPWRLERLRRLKAEYDPFNRFRYYSPIVEKKSCK
ncbi:FAD binding domain-containing protein [Colletotrichum musicola]|uniref:FAD binding domain-containing protein n=1 Tax=Colletotrichum musicola TaxID=2175873 RepID=A0A8H6N854_9PEZI|nr:FAD binding domain-containing protein [Colletotrichum musicola]